MCTTNKVFQPSMKRCLGLLIEKNNSQKCLKYYTQKWLNYVQNKNKISKMFVTKIGLRKLCAQSKIL